MTVEVVTSFKVKANGKEVILHPGQRVKLDSIFADRLISEGKVKVVKVFPVKIYSRLFDEAIYVVADQEELETLALKGVKEVIYVAWEIPALRGMEREWLRAVHLTKKVFPGSALA